jgi:hypothetical protein
MTLINKLPSNAFPVFLFDRFFVFTFCRCSITPKQYDIAIERSLKQITRLKERKADGEELSAKQVFSQFISHTTIDTLYRLLTPKHHHLV